MTFEHNSRRSTFELADGRGQSPIGTNLTNWVDALMSVNWGKLEVACRGQNGANGPGVDVCDTSRPHPNIGATADNG